uniref:Uncharacterized protein n=1 Tax=Sphaerodactylus townsendi TaxID=933632 RepID=A0ACB8F0H0_9SAUR
MDHYRLEWKGTNADQKNPYLLVQHILRWKSEGGRDMQKDEGLWDEVYCQVIKQTTENPNSSKYWDSCHPGAGKSLESPLTGYFLPSSTLMPCVAKYLQQTSSDITGPFSGKSAKKSMPYCQNISALVGNSPPLAAHTSGCLLAALFSNGRNARLVLISLPGDISYNTRIKTFTAKCKCVTSKTVELALVIILNGKIVQPLRKTDYIHDYLLEESSIGLSFCRTAWKTPLHFENAAYINIHYNQASKEKTRFVLQNYIKGKLLLKHSYKLEQQVGTLALLQHWARGAGSVPSVQELRDYIPEPVAQLVDLSTIQALVTHLLDTMKPLEQHEAKISFIEYVIKLPLFSYNVYPLEKVSTPGIPMPCFVGVNQEQIVVMDGKSQAKALYRTTAIILEEAESHSQV